MTKNKTTVKPFSDHVLVYTKQPTTKNTKPGDVVLYKKEIWINNGHIVASIPPKDVDKEVLKENTMENYIVINGKRAELTEEQLNSLCMFNRFAQMAKEQFGLTITPKETAGETFKTLFGVDFSDCSERTNPFDSSPRQVHVYSIGHVGVQTFGSMLTPIDLSMTESLVNTANSFNDYDFARQLYLHELLNRKLLKYSWDNEAEDRSWNGDNFHYYIIRDNRYRDGRYFVSYRDYYKENSTVYFSKKDVAEKAVEDVVKPFMRLNPDFVW